MEALGEDEKQLAQLIEEEKKNLKELCEEVTKAKEQKRKKQEEYNAVCKEFTDAYGIALSQGERYRAVALDGTQFQPAGVINEGGSSDLKEKAKKLDENIIRKMWDRLNLLHEELRNLHYTNAKRELDVEMISNKIIQLQFRLKFVQQQEKEEIITNTVQQQQEQQKQQEIVDEKVKQAVLPTTDALERRRIIYEEQVNAWEREVTAYENSQKKLSRDVKHRELFEKTFIELKERNNRVERSRISLTPGGNGIATLLPSTSTQIQINDQNEADLGQIGLENQKQQIDAAFYQATVVPPLSSNPPRRFFDNSDGLEDNSLAETQKQLEISQTVWTDAEKAVFTEKITLYPKNFAAIAVFLPTKTVQECVHFYYMTKKEKNYKKTFRQRRKKKTGKQRYRPPTMPRFADTDGNSKVAKRPYPQQQPEQSSSNKLPTSSTICQPPKKKKRIDVEAINILAKVQVLKKLDSYSNEQRNNILKMFFEKLDYEYIPEDFVQALYQFSIKQRKQIVQTSAGSQHGNNE